jgi:hypothetical protein
LFLENGESSERVPAMKRDGMIKDMEDSHRLI